MISRPVSAKMYNNKEKTISVNSTRLLLREKILAASSRGIGQGYTKKFIYSSKSIPRSDVSIVVVATSVNVVDIEYNFTE